MFITIKVDKNILLDNSDYIRITENENIISLKE